MDVRPAQSRADVRGAIEVNRTAWRVAYADILPESTLPEPNAPLSAESVEGRFADVTNRRETAFLVACDGDSTSDPNVVDAEATGGDSTVTDSAVDADSADADTTIYGFAEFVWGEERTEFVPEDAVELRALYVDPDRWRQGIGTALLDAVADALPDGTTALAVETFSENETGRRFYEARGFELVDERAFDVDGESHPTVVYRKSLSSSSSR
ncbi:Acetyltransferase (GNAT) family protein [Halogranum rubrum]|uniref:Acetyltransferase (GNAT) family protein n=1 Tax=Halogranum rubrum TaxID=553466 RepID=A0A1I4H9G8_9EURY|nr:GNAT family N-acetyltransferase [Halogranum rubrum]SFL38257.1 Acetyltransferase (GNAT) family protein [Halogranum rubrum]